ncbi:MAG: helix-turn-helix domain-containing protein [Bacteroidetes bacterium]|nr:helix-turn-helix domain-containing protein [Bacteroidota bacterium]
MEQVFFNVPLSELEPIFKRWIKEAQRELLPKEVDEQKEDYPLTVQEAGKFLSLAIPTIYSKVSKGELPFMKRSKRLYFSRNELMEYIKEGRNKTNAEIEIEAEQYLDKKKGVNHA